MGFLESGAGVLPPVKVNAVPPTGSIDEYTAEDSNYVRNALLDLRDYARGTRDLVTTGNEDASAARILAGSRTRVWYRTSAPVADPADPFRVDDLWFDTSLYTQADVDAGLCAIADIGKKKYDAYRWDGSAWEKVNRQKLIIAAEIAAGAIAAQHISSVGLDASVITSGIISAQFLDVEGIVIGAANVDATLQAVIYAARDNANAALEQLGNIGSDDKVTRNERSTLMRDARSAFSEFALYMGMAAQYDGTGHEVDTAAYEAAFAALDAHLKAAVGDETTPGGLGFPTDYGTVEASATTWVKLGTPDPIPVDGATLRRVFEVYYLERASMLEAMATASRLITDALGGEIQNARDDLDIVLPKLADMASDSRITQGEKADVMREARECAFEYPALLAQSQRYDSAAAPVDAAAKAAYTQAWTELDNYLKAAPPSGLGFPADYATVKASADAWIADATTIVLTDGGTMRSRFEQYFLSRRDLVDAVWAANKALSDTKLQASDLEPLWTDIGKAQDDATAALGRLDVVGSDSWLSKGEKPAVYREWLSVNGESSDYPTRATAAGVSSASYTAAFVALRDYLVALSPGFNDVNTDTPIDPATWQTRWSNYYAARTALATAIFNAKIGSGDVNRNVTSISGGVITTGYVNAARIQADAIQTQDYAWTGAHGANNPLDLGTASEVATRGGRLRNGAATDNSGAELPAGIFSPKGIKIGAKTLDQTWLAQGRLAAAFLAHAAGSTYVGVDTAVSCSAGTVAASGDIKIGVGVENAGKSAVLLMNGRISGSALMVYPDSSAPVVAADGSITFRVMSINGVAYTVEVLNAAWQAQLWILLNVSSFA